MLASLALLPQHLIEEGFFVVMADSPDEQLPALIEFNNYFVSQWMENPVIGLSWSCAGESHRTKNFIEPWHHRVNGPVFSNFFFLTMSYSYLIFETFSLPLQLLLRKKLKVTVKLPLSYR